MRRVRGPEIYPHLLAKNVPIWSDSIETTGLLSKGSADILLAEIEAWTGVAMRRRSVVAVQVYDCEAAGAPGIVIETPASSSDALVVYPNPDAPGATAVG